MIENTPSLNDSMRALLIICGLLTLGIMDQPFKGGQLVALFFPVLRPCLRLVPSYLISGVYFNGPVALILLTTINSGSF
jgi:hypothetical protein